MKKNIADFSKYKKLGEPSMLEKSGLWETAIGVQKVDGLTPSNYLIETAQKHIEGDIDIDEVDNRLRQYYKTRPVNAETEKEREADEVSARITRILSEKTFSFSPVEYITIHKRLFEDILSPKIAGKIRDYNIEKSEWVLNGATVYYAGADNIGEILEYDFALEKKFDYRGLNEDEFIEHFAKFISDIWQIHPFGEGNTRTTAVFAIKYLRTLGFNADNELFKEHSWYFRNALARANYTDHKNGIYPAMEYLTQFFENLLLNKNNILKNRYMHIYAKNSDKTAKITDISGQNTDKTAKITDIIKKNTDKLTNKEIGFLKSIFEFLKEKGEINNRQAQELSGKSAESVKKYFAALVAAGILSATGLNKGRKYKMNEELK